MRKTLFFLALILLSCAAFAPAGADAGVWNSEFCYTANPAVGASSSSASPTGSSSASFTNRSCAQRTGYPTQDYGAGIEQVSGTAAQGTSRAHQWSLFSFVGSDINGGWLQSIEFPTSGFAVRANNGTNACLWLSWANALTGQSGTDSSCITSSSVGSWFVQDVASTPTTAGKYHINQTAIDPFINRADGSVVVSIAIGLRCSNAGGCPTGSTTQLVYWRDMTITTKENISPKITMSNSGLPGYVNLQGDVYCDIGSTNCGTASISTSSYDPVSSATGSGPAYNVIEISSNGGSSWNRVILGATTQGALEKGERQTNSYLNWNSACGSSAILSSVPTPSSSISSACGSAFSPRIDVPLATSFAPAFNTPSLLRACTYDYDASNPGPRFEPGFFGIKSCSSATSFMLDNQAPAPPSIVSGPSGVTGDDTPAWGFAGEAGASFECALAQGEASPSYSACTSPKGYGPLTNGQSYTFYVRQTDSVGHVSSPASQSITVNTTVPNASWTSTPASPTNDAILSYDLSFTESVSGISSNDFLNLGTATGCTFQPSASSGTSVSISVQDCSEGTVVLRLKADSVQGSTNLGPSDPVDADTVVIDRTAPPAPTITGGPIGPTADQNPSFSFTGEVGAQFRCNLVGYGPPTVCTSPASYGPLASPADYTFNVTQEDAAGNVSDAASRSFRVDTTVPNGSWTSTPASPTNAATLSYTLSFDSAVYGLSPSSFKNTGSATGCTFSPSASFGTSFTVLAQNCSEGTVVATLKADAVENSVGTKGPESDLVASSVLVDRTGTPPPVITGGPIGSTSDVTPTFSWEGDGTLGLSFYCTLEVGTAVPVSGDYSLCTSPKSYGPIAQDGEYTFWVKQLDAAGNMSPPSSRTFDLVTTTPDASWASVPLSPTNATTLHYTLSFTESVTGIASEDFVNLGSASGCLFAPTASAGESVGVLVTACSEGTVVLALKADSVQGASRNGPPSAVEADEVAIDRTAPAAPSILSGPEGPITENSAAFAFSGEANASFECSLGSGYSSCTSPKTYSSLANGTYTFSVRQTDTAGNVSAPADRTFQVLVPPTASWTEPASPTNAASLSYNLDFSASVTGLVSSDIAVSGSSSGCAVSPLSSSGSSIGVQVSGCSDGTVVLTLLQGSVVSGGASGPVSAVASTAVVIERTAPPTPEITGKPAAEVATQNPQFVFSGQGADFFQCNFDGSSWLLCASPYTANTLAPGLHVFYLRSGDLAGNFSDPTSYQFRVCSKPTLKKAGKATRSYLFVKTVASGCKITLLGKYAKAKTKQKIVSPSKTTRYKLQYTKKLRKKITSARKKGKKVSVQVTASAGGVGRSIRIPVR